MGVVEQEDRLSLGSSIQRAFWFVAFLWFVKLNEWVLDQSLTGLGVYPLHWEGLIGILTAPLIHGSAQHLMSNSLPLVILGSALVYGYPKSRWYAVGIIWGLSGIGVWLFARQVYHIGASGLTHGLFFYLLVISVLRRDNRSVALMMIAFFMYGSMLLTIFPREIGISFEYHFFGGMSGVLCAFLFRHWDPRPEEKVYSWEREEQKDSNEAEDLIGDEWMLDHQKPQIEMQIENKNDSLDHGAADTNPSLELEDESSQERKLDK